MKRILCTVAAIVISTAAFIPTQAVAQVNFSVVIGNAPPPVRYEIVPAPRRGYEWAPGYWNLDRGRHVWARGHWVRARSGQYYQRPEWYQSNGGWRLNRGGWKHDKRHDKKNEKEYRKNGRGDRDGDGVRNRRDSNPNNPRRN
ncbi:MAG: YXWGXW repeat-containing protein [Burkholderiaceae bacterium]